MGFLPKTSLEIVRSQYVSLIPKCGSCQLFSDSACRSPKMKPTGQGARKILIVGEAPGKEENELGAHFIGKGGRFLRHTLKGMGIDLERDCWSTNSVICWPHKNGKSRKPTNKELVWCQPTLENTIRELQPNVILLLGKSPVASFFNERFPGAMTKRGISRWLGWNIPSRFPNAWVCPALHPSFLLKEENNLLDKEWKLHLQEAISHDSKPWESIPNEKLEIKKIFDDSQAAEAIGKMANGGKPVAWDLECDRLKPDDQKSRIFSCSLSDGTTTISFPWFGKVLGAMKEFLRSPVWKIGSNIKYEIRWIKAKLGITPKNFVWDCMLTMHAIDNRPGICGVDFMTYTLLGAPDYWTWIEPWMKSKTNGGNDSNRMGEVDLANLLLYGGLDSLFEWKIAKIQAEILGVELV